MKNTKQIWNLPTKIPKVFRQTKAVSFPVSSNRNCPLSHTVNLDIRRSKDVLCRTKHKKTHYRLGDNGWGNYPDSQYGKYKYFICHYVIYDDGDKGWENEGGYEFSEMEWSYLLKCVDAGYTW